MEAYGFFAILIRPILYSHSCSYSGFCPLIVLPPNTPLAVLIGIFDIFIHPLMYGGLLFGGVVALIIGAVVFFRERRKNGFYDSKR